MPVSDHGDWLSLSFSLLGRVPVSGVLLGSIDGSVGQGPCKRLGSPGYRLCIGPYMLPTLSVEAPSPPIHVDCLFCIVKIPLWLPGVFLFVVPSPFHEVEHLTIVFLMFHYAFNLVFSSVWFLPVDDGQLPFLSGDFGRYI